jgi:transposase-like protein
MSTPKTLTEAIRHFADFENCKAFMVARRWPNGVTCPMCGSDAVYWDSSRKGWECKTRHPQRKFTLKTGTIFEDSPLGLDKWLPAVWMIANMKNGVSSHELARSLGVTQKTAWFMLHRIRLAMQDDSTGGKLGGNVEVDETYIGGKARNMHITKRKRVGISQGRSMAGKVAVMGVLERHPEKGHSRIRLQGLDGRRRRHMVPHIIDNVEPGTNVHTDELFSYQGLEKRGFVHNVINHAEAYVNGQVHTNGCENFWSLLKRGLKGTYVNVEPFHLFRYLDEQAFRFNERTLTDAQRFALALGRIVGKRVMYSDLTAAHTGSLPA